MTSDAEQSPAESSAPTASATDAGAAASRLGVVVVNFASHEMTVANLAALDPKSLNAVVVVVDSYSSEAERERISDAALSHNWHLLTPSTNVGFGAGMNLGVARALQSGCTEVLLLNPDVTMSPPALVDLWRRAKADPSSIFCPLLLRPDGSTWFAGGKIELRTGRTRTRAMEQSQDRSDWLTGACLLLSTPLWRKLGGFDERYFMYWEDVDLSQRCLTQHGNLQVAREIQAVHQVGGTQGSKRKSDLYTYYVCRNRLLFASIHLSRRERMRWLLHTPTESWRIAMRDGRRSAVRRPRYMLATLRGSAAGALVVIASLKRR